MSTHLHCPSCNHCATLHRLGQAQKVPFLPPSGPILLQCAACASKPGTEGLHLCPAGEKPDSASETLRIMFIQEMRDTITEVGI